MRQQPDEFEFIETLGKLRYGLSDSTTFERLNCCIIGCPDLRGQLVGSGSDAILVTQRHSLRREVNRMRTISMAKTLDQPVFCYSESIFKTRYTVRLSCSAITELEGDVSQQARKSRVDLTSYNRNACNPL